MRPYLTITFSLACGFLSSCLYYPPQQGPPIQQGPTLQGPQVGVNQGPQGRYNQGRAPQTSQQSGTTGGPVYNQGNQTAPQQAPPNVVIEGYNNPSQNPIVEAQTDESTAQTNPDLANQSTPPPVTPNAEPEGGYPYATPVAGKVGMVHSPYARDKGWVDVSGIAPGTKVHDPHTGKIFLVP